MVRKATTRRKLSASPGQERSKPVSPPPQGRSSTSGSKPGVTQFQSKGARNDMELNFDRYCSLEKSSQTDSMTGRGLAQFLAEIIVPPDSFDYYVLLWKLGATEKGCVSRAEWVTAMYANAIESLVQLKSKLTEWVKEVRENAANLVLMYNFMYDYIRGEEDRCMSLTNATEAWNVFFEEKGLLPQWKLWAADHVKSDVSRDLWRQVGLLLALYADPKQSGSTTNSTVALPAIITDFLEQNKKLA